MNKIVGYTVLFVIADIVVLLLFSLIANLFFTSDRQYDLSGVFFVLIGFPIFLLVQMIVGGVLASKPKTKDLGKAMLLSAGIILLVGLALCGGSGIF